MFFLNVNNYFNMGFIPTALLVLVNKCHVCEITTPFTYLGGPGIKYLPFDDCPD